MLAAPRAALPPWLQVVVGAALVLWQLAAGADAPALVAVAANMTGAAEETADRFHDDTGLGVRLTFGASGNLSRQILRGAPFQLFLSADRDYPRRLYEAGVAEGVPRAYAVGRLALYLSPGDGPTPASPSGSDDEQVRSALTAPDVKRLAIANPAHAPYGRAARQVLEHLSLWHRFQSRLIVGENVTQAARFARTHTVPAALLPFAVVLEPELAGGRHLLIPAAWHDPIEQDLVLIRGAGSTARRFMQYLLGDAGRTILARRGFALPPPG